MENKFTQIAEQALGNSPIMTGREKISTEEVIRKYPDGVTLTAFDIIDNGKDGYAVFTIQEEPAKFINGGALLSKMAFEWVKAYEGSIEDASADLDRCGGVNVRLSVKKTRRGNTITAVEIVK